MLMIGPWHQGGLPHAWAQTRETDNCQQDHGCLLHSVSHNGSLPWFQVQRAKIVLAIAAGERCCSVAARLECDESQRSGGPVNGIAAMG